MPAADRTRSTATLHRASVYAVTYRDRAGHGGGVYGKAGHSLTLFRALQSSAAPIICVGLVAPRARDFPDLRIAAAVPTLPRKSSSTCLGDAFCRVLTPHANPIILDPLTRPSCMRCGLAVALPLLRPLPAARFSADVRRKPRARTFDRSSMGPCDNGD